MRRPTDVAVTVTVSKDELRDLTQLAVTEGCSVATLWRRAMNHYLTSRNLPVTLVETRSWGRPKKRTA